MAPASRRGSSRRRPREKLVVRRARPEDRGPILEMSKSIWGGEDYLHLVWDSWAADRNGVLLTVTHRGVPVGTSKITLLSPGEVWLEGLRLHPDYHGRGLSRQIHDATFREATRLNPKSVRYSTWIGNEASRHIAETHGFWQIARASWMWGKATDHVKLRSRIATKCDVNALVEFVTRSDCFASTNGLMGVGWKFPALTRRRIVRLVSEDRALVLPRRGPIRAAALFDVGDVDDDICLGFVEGTDEDIAALARDVLSVAAGTGRNEASAMLPEGRIARAVHAAGFDAEQVLPAVVYELGARGVRGGDGRFEDVVRRTLRANESDAVDAVAELIADRAPAKISRENVRDFLLRGLMPDTARKLESELFELSNRTRQNSARLILRAIVMHLHEKHGLSGDALDFRKRSLVVRHMGRRLATATCFRESVKLALGPGFGPCFARRTRLSAEEVTLVPASRDRATGRYEAATLLLTKRRHIAGATRAIDIIMKSAAKGADRRR